MQDLDFHIQYRRKEYDRNAEDMRARIRSLAKMLSAFAEDIDNADHDRLADYMQSLQTDAARGQRTLDRYRETRAALGALLALKSAD